ncbi:VRR-NUC domain-containing protein [Actinoplanes sp. CA-051413]|uniref:VRR-NUC domain-containing protein n=1 Tax=Actinoplanes sp. CA-051413 TaxID=3239899 RepID=UPI003D978BBC
MTAPAVSEDALLRTILEMAKRMGVLAAHFRPAQSQTGRWLTAVQGDGKGYPDVTLVGKGGVLFRELKAARGSLSREQKVWLAALEEAGADMGVWRPVDLQSGRIEAEIRAVRKSRAVAL